MTEDERDKDDLIVQVMIRQAAQLLAAYASLTAAQRAIIQKVLNERPPELEFIEELEERLIKGSISSVECDAWADELEREMEA